MHGVEGNIKMDLDEIGLDGARRMNVAEQGVSREVL